MDESALSTEPLRPAVLLNARAKRVTSRTIRAFENASSGWDLFVSDTLEEAETCIRVILDRGYRVVILGGGDGTVAATLRLMLKVGAEPKRRRIFFPDLALLSLGTGNALGALVSAGRPVDDALKVLEGRFASSLELRVLEDPDRRDAFSFASVGYDAQVLNDFVQVVEGTRTRFGRMLMQSFWGYLYAVGTRTVLSEVRRRPTRARVVSLGRASMLDRETDEEIPLDPGSTLFEGVARALLFGTSPFYGYGLKALPFARKRADRFHLRVSTASIPYVFRHLPSIWRGTHRTDRFLDFLVEDVRIETNQPIAFQVSGDARGRVDSMRVRLSERSFRLLKVAQTPPPPQG